MTLLLRRQAGTAEAESSQPPHCLPVRVYYEDTDFSGYVYHASYLRFLERGRTEFLRARGIEHRGMFTNGAPGGLFFVVRSMIIDFLKPAFMDDALLVETGIARVGGASVEMAQRIRRESGLVLTAKVKVGLVQSGKPMRIPEEVLARLKLTAVISKNIVENSKL